MTTTTVPTVAERVQADAAMPEDTAAPGYVTDDQATNDRLAGQVDGRSMELAGCPRWHHDHNAPVTVSQVTVTNPAALLLWPGVATPIDGRKVTWELSCGCSLSGAEWEISVRVDQPFRLNRRRAGGEA